MCGAFCKARRNSIVATDFSWNEGGRDYEHRTDGKKQRAGEEERGRRDPSRVALPVQQAHVLVHPAHPTPTPTPASAVADHRPIDVVIDVIANGNSFVFNKDDGEREVRKRVRPIGDIYVELEGLQVVVLVLKLHFSCGAKALDEGERKFLNSPILLSGHSKTARSTQQEQEHVPQLDPTRPRQFIV